MKREGGMRFALDVKKLHISELNGHSKNKCSLVSSRLLQRIHVDGTGMPQLLNLSRVCSLFQVATQHINACFGIRSLNHTAECHETGWDWGFMAIHVLAVENLFEGAWWPDFQRYESSCVQSIKPVGDACNQSNPTVSFIITILFQSSYKVIKMVYQQYRILKEALLQVPLKLLTSKYNAFLKLRDYDYII